MITLLAATIFAFHPQKLDINVDAKAGDVISGIRHFEVRVSSDDPITQVEFYVNNELEEMIGVTVVIN